MTLKLKHRKHAQRTIEKRFLAYYLVNKDNGRGWYGQALQICLKLAQRYQIDVLKVAGIMSALSPQSSWDINVDNTKIFLSGETKDNGTQIHNGRQLGKCEDILYLDDLTKENVCDVLRGNKTVNFFLNIIGDLTAVTVDRHIICMATDSNIKPGLTTNQYNTIKLALISVAHKHNEDPANFQAIAWSNYRDAKYPPKVKEVEGICPF